MGIKERREREKLELRESILAAARDIAGTEGWGAVSIRKIADRIEYSPPMVYEYFDDKDDLLYALMVDGFRQLAERLHEARVSADDPEQALLAMAGAYWQFSVDSRELYQVMNGLDGVQFCDRNRAEAAPEFSAAGIEGVAALLNWGDATGLTFDHPEDMLSLLWGVLHGLISLYMGGRVQSTPEHMQAQLRQAVLTLLNGWHCK